jgi:hypothetical protein
MSDDNPFSVLPRDANPNPELRDRVLSELQRRGLVSRGSSGAVRGALGLAAAAILFLMGWAVGRPAAPVALPAGESYVLLLYSSDSLEAAAPHSVVAAEYRAWAEGLGTRFVDGEALGEQRLLGGNVGPDIPTGYFIIRADSWDGAMAIARDCPHLRRGGVVAVRAIME